MSETLKKRPIIFVSHRRNDEFVQALREDLPSYDILVSDWRDGAGEGLAPKVQTDIARADVVVVVLTESARQSQWVEQEIGFSLGRGLKIIPVFEPSEGSKELPALLAGLEWEPYDQAAISAAAHRTALRVNRVLERDLVKIFQTWLEYREWWFTKDERQYTNQRCYWATPHDTLSWLYPHQPLKGAYRVLIRGDLEFDLKTARRYEASEVVWGVWELSAVQETTVLGNLSVLTLWEPDFQREIDEFLRGSPSAEQLMNWYSDVSQKKTSIEIRMSFDEARADRDVRRLDALFQGHRAAARSTSIG